MNVLQMLEARANELFAECKGLTLYTDTPPSEMEEKTLWVETLEEKVRFVRTRAGVARFKKPIGSIIGGGGKTFDNIKVMDPVFEGWDLVKGKNGKKYDVGKDGGKWSAYGHNDWDDHIATADSQDALMEALDKHAGGGKSKPSQRDEPRDRSYQRGADRLRRAGITEFENNQARRVDEMTSDQWKAAQRELGNGKPLSEVLSEHAGGGKKAPANGGTTASREPKAGSRMDVINQKVNEKREGESPFKNLTAAQKKEYGALSTSMKNQYHAQRYGLDKRGNDTIVASHAEAMRKVNGTQRTKDSKGSNPTTASATSTAGRLTASQKSKHALALSRIEQAQDMEPGTKRDNAIASAGRYLSLMKADDTFPAAKIKEVEAAIKKLKPTSSRVQEARRKAGREFATSRATGAADSAVSQFGTARGVRITAGKDGSYDINTDGGKFKVIKGRQAGTYEVENWNGSLVGRYKESQLGTIADDATRRVFRQSTSDSSKNIHRPNDPPLTYSQNKEFMNLSPTVQYNMRHYMNTLGMDYGPAKAQAIKDEKAGKEPAGIGKFGAIKPVRNNNPRGKAQGALF